MPLGFEGIYSTVSTVKGFRAPGRYLQGPGVLRRIGKVVRVFGSKGLAIADDTVMSIVKGVVEKSFADQGLSIEFEVFRRECSWEEINRVKDVASRLAVDFIMAFGGGKAIDTGKAVANLLEIPFVSIPTIASTDAPTSAISVVYTEPYPGEYVEDVFWPRNPDLVIVDTGIIAKANPRFLAAGMGDASSKLFEGRAVVQSFGRNFVFSEYREKRGVEPLGAPLLGLQLCKLTYNVIRRYGEAAMHSVRKRSVTPALELVVEANTLLSGLGFENTGVAAAHSIYFGFTKIHHKMDPPQHHGELVAFGTIVQLVMEGTTLDKVLDYMKWAHSVGLPVNLEELGLTNLSDEDLWKVAETAYSVPHIHNEPFDVEPEMIVSSIRTADEIGRKFSQQYPRSPYE